jgi:hypothetical protein
VSVCRIQAISCSAARRFRRRNRMEINGISTKAMTCFFDRSKIVFNRG